jgi:hypothetical protein
MAILISYRNEDSPMLSAHLHTALAQRMGARNFIFGVNEVVEPGDIVADAIKQGVQNCDLLMVFIGQNWASTSWSKNANDPDVLAITTAQTTNKRVIPVFLMDGIQLDREALNPSVASLLDRAPFVCKNEDDAVKLTQTLQKFVTSTNAIVTSQNTPNTPSTSSVASKPLGFDAPVEQKPMFGVQSAAKVDEFGIEQNAVMGKVVVYGNNQELFIMPFLGAEVRTLVPNGAHTIILARDNNTQWLNVVYISTTGQPIAGWMPIGAVRDISYLNMPVQVMDLPISNFEYNTFEEVKQVKKKLDKLRQGVAWKYLMWVIVVCAILGGIWGLADPNLGQSRDYRYNTSARTSSYVTVYQDDGQRALTGALIGGGIGLFFYWIPLLFAPRYRDLSKEIVRMKAIQQSKKGAGTITLENIAKVGMVAAGVLGAGAMMMKGKERQHQQNLANKGAYGRIDINKR